MTKTEHACAAKGFAAPPRKHVRSWSSDFRYFFCAAKGFALQISTAIREQGNVARLGTLIRIFTCTTD
jgi:hypothetical protein